MDTEILSTTTFKPSPPSSPSHHAHIPLTIFDKAAIDRHVRLIFAFLPPTPPNVCMKRGLAKALAYFPHLAGRFSVDEQGSPSILLNHDGIRLIEAQVNMALAERLPLEPSHELTTLPPPTAGVEELLQIQLNRFSCGGLVIGATFHHRVADGQAMNTFFLAWAKLVQDLDMDPIPNHDRAAISVPRNPPMCNFNHQAVELRQTAAISKSPSPNSSCSASSIQSLIVHFSAHFIAKLKAHVIGGDDEGCRRSTFECLLAHLWKKITLARGLQEDEHTQVRISVNGRARMKPAIPMEYFGNLVLWAFPKLRVRDLLDENHAFVARKIHDAVGRIDDAYFKSFIDFGELSKEVEMTGTVPDVGDCLCPDLEVDSWLRFQFHDLDYGYGGPCAFLIPNLPVEGLLIFIPSCREKGGIEVIMSLLAEHVNHFKQICQSLD
ncbi:hypothetical protein ACLOJK_015718 [Asimina triloba]